MRKGRRGRRGRGRKKDEGSRRSETLTHSKEAQAQAQARWLPVLQPTQHPVGRVSNVNLMFLSIHLKLPAD